MDEVKCEYDCDKCNVTFVDDLYPEVPMDDGILCQNCLRAKVKEGDKITELWERLPENIKHQGEQYRLRIYKRDEYTIAGYNIHPDGYMIHYCQEQTILEALTKLVEWVEGREK